MRFYFDLDLGRFVSKPGFNGLLSRVEFKRGDAAKIVVGFYRGTTPTALAGTPSEMVFVVKKDVTDAALVMIIANTWTSSEEGTVWTAPLMAGSDTLNAEIGSASYKDWLAEFTYTDDNGGPTTSQTLNARVNNDLWKGTEGTPLEELDPEAWLEARRPAPLDLTVPPTNGVLQQDALDFGTVIAPYTGTITVTLTSADVDGGTPVVRPVSVTAFQGTNAIRSAVLAALSSYLPIYNAFILSDPDTSILFVRRASGQDDSFSVVVSDPEEVLSYGPITSSNLVTGTASNAIATSLGQGLIVTLPGGNTYPKIERDVFTCVCLSPILWSPPGNVYLDTGSGIYYRHAVLPSTGAADFGFAYNGYD